MKKNIIKTFSVRKIGYRAGVYGCIAEYFIADLFENGEVKKSYNFYGLYGAESRIADAIKEKGYKHIHVANFYGKVQLDTVRFFQSEYSTIGLINDTHIEAYTVGKSKKIYATFSEAFKIASETDKSVNTIVILK